MSEPELTPSPNPASPSRPPLVGGILPGMAAIAIFLLFTSMVTAFQVLQDKSGPPAERYSILGVCTLVVIGIFGLLKLRRWGWAMVCGGCLIGVLGNLLAFHTTHIGGFLIRGLFLLVFFFYMVRTEVRDRVH